MHNWCGGTLQNPATASYDPIFWMLHTPTLSATDRVLDPWASTITEVDDTVWDLGYRYG